MMFGRGLVVRHVNEVRQVIRIPHKSCLVLLLFMILRRVCSWRVGVKKIVSQGKMSLRRLISDFGGIGLMR